MYLSCTFIGCAKGEFECGDGQCLPAVSKCNQLEECPDGSDEADCRMSHIPSF